LADYWSNKIVFARVKGLELASLTFEVVADFAKPLPTAFGLIVTARGFGVFLGRTTVNPIADGPITLRLAVPGETFGDLLGEIHSWHGIDSKGAVLLPAAGASWQAATSVAFAIDGKANVSVPTAAIAALVPHLGWAVALALEAFGKQVTFSIAHDSVVLPIHRDKDGKPLPESV
jgi:hypothetical protein